MASLSGSSTLDGRDALRLAFGIPVAMYLGVKAGQGVELAVTFLLRRLRRAHALRKYRTALAMPLADVITIRDEMVEQAEVSLAGEPGSTMPMLPSYVEHLPRGSETGSFFALDLGGTNLHMMYVHLTPSSSGDGIKSSTHAVTIDRELLGQPVEHLFEFIAEEGKAFMGRFVNLGEETPAIGFTFSFPMQQTGIAEGQLLRWTKGFACPDGPGEDPVKLLKEAFRRKGVQVRVPALVNDTIGLLAAAKYHHQDCKLAVILGTGTNAAYMERKARVRVLPTHSDGGPAKEGWMGINTEWSDFTTRKVKLLQEDRELDAASVNVGLQMFEKMMSGRNIGEIVRRILLSMANRGLLWPDTGCPFALRVPYGLPSWVVSKIDDSGTPLETARVELAELGLLVNGSVGLSRGELAAVVSVCRGVGRRAARLSAAGILAILRLMEIDGSTGAAPASTISIDGSLYDKYSAFRRQLHEAMMEVLGREVFSRIKIVHLEDGSGVGAALLAAASV